MNIIKFFFPKWGEPTKEEKIQMNRIKNYFRLFFEGDFHGMNAIIPINIDRFGITNLQFEFRKEKVVFTITLERPGILIGKGGETIDGLKDFLKNWEGPESKPIEIKIIESKLWNYVR